MSSIWKNYLGVGQETVYVKRKDKVYQVEQVSKVFVIEVLKILYNRVVNDQAKLALLKET